MLVSYVALERLDATVSMHDHVNRLPAPGHWATRCTQDECTIHQLSPYIGKLKSRIARDLITQYTRPGDLVADPFCGSGTIPLEAANLGRRTFASDASLYAAVLTKGKLAAPATLEDAQSKLDRVIHRVEALPLPTCDDVPSWVRQFFHPSTLAETTRLARYLSTTRQFFLLACLLGILHHQRPGFLSYPSSNLVPYLRTRKFPRDRYPNLYDYRPVEPRLRAKLARAYARPPSSYYHAAGKSVRKSTVENVTLPSQVNCIMTSPPYMNALDYVRDNRLRLWLLDNGNTDYKIDQSSSNPNAFRRLARTLAKMAQKASASASHCIVIVGEKVTRNTDAHPSRLLRDEFVAHAPSLRLKEMIEDRIPDVRRSRRNLAGVKREHILIFSKVSK